MLLRDVAWNVAPGYMAGRARRYEAGVRARAGLTVSGGPFAGLRFPTDLRGVGAPRLKLEGSYEEQLHPFVEEMMLRRVFIDSGSADGYYAVGAAWRGRDVHAFELARSGRKLTRDVARLNGVSIHQHRKASGPALRSLPLDDTAVLCDIEGAEGDVFDRETCRALSSCMVVIETHDAQRPGVTEELIERFERPHELIDEHGSADEMRSDSVCWLVFR